MVQAPLIFRTLLNIKLTMFAHFDVGSFFFGMNKSWLCPQNTDSHIVAYVSNRASWKSSHCYSQDPLVPLLPFLCPVITDCFLWFFLLSSCHRTCIDSSRWELTQLFSWMAAIFLFCFILTLLSLFIHFLLCQDKKVIYSYLWTQILPLVSCYSFPIIHSDYFTALLVVLLRHPIAPGTKSKSKLLTVASEFS